ncbi:uncharacterized protein LOC131468088 isoform X2 [Solea solea]|uniref:uncharacterized protein LOC131468088 isoform X2 n=1 Tax=Solea solea TaxID=90069 RepID=UPI00272BE4FB|nr:uncharacterized protein LOC131468088 isoform X2 [Solea solea]
MAVRAAALLLLLLGRTASIGTGFGSEPDSERGRMQLQRVQSLTAHSRYGECWAQALEHLDTRCKDMTSESQGRIALGFTYCHLSSSGRDFPSCPEGSDVSRCTRVMDAVAFNTYTEFFTHTHAICHFLQSETWQNRAETTMYRLTESSAGVAEQLQSTRQMAEELIEAQSAALQAQQEILTNGEELRLTLRDSTEGLRTVFSELSSSSREQQVALSELFNRVSFLHSFLLMESHSVSSCCYNAAALCAAFLLTATQRSSRARLLLLSLVCLNFYLELKIHQFITSDQPEHRDMERLSVYVSVLRRIMACVGVCVLVLACLRYRDPLQHSLQMLQQQLTQTQHGLQEALQRAERLTDTWRTVKGTEDGHTSVLAATRRVHQGSERRRRREEELRRKQEEESVTSLITDSTHLSHLSQSAHDASVSPGRHDRRPRPSPLVYSVLVEDKRPRYSLRSRRSETH